MLQLLMQALSHNSYFTSFAFYNLYLMEYHFLLKLFLFCIKILQHNILNLTLSTFNRLSFIHGLIFEFFASKIIYSYAPFCQLYVRCPTL